MDLEQKIYVQICALFTLYIYSCIENDQWWTKYTDQVLE